MNSSPSPPSPFPSYITLLPPYPTHPPLTTSTSPPPPSHSSPLHTNSIVLTLLHPYLPPTSSVMKFYPPRPPGHQPNHSPSIPRRDPALHRLSTKRRAPAPERRIPPRAVLGRRGAFAGVEEGGRGREGGSAGGGRGDGGRGGVAGGLGGADGVGKWGAEGFRTADVGG